ncbi:MAG: hypothetical protein LBS01_04435 [Prevotellaceae bacterium]|jgi:hypothetical protein|nr:hypothetical protein [Prevotellaceae bacterium]
MKKVLKLLGLAGFTGKQKAIVIYFAISFCLIGSVADAPVWALVALLLNFANAARLLRKIPMPDNKKN